MTKENLSPKGLVAVITEPFDLEAGLQPAEELRDLIGAMKERASATITSAGKDPSQARSIKRNSTQGDAVYHAASVLLKLAECERWARKLPAPGGAAYRLALEAMRAGLMLGSLMTVESEAATVSGAKSDRAGARGREIRHGPKTYRDKRAARAREFYQQNLRDMTAAAALQKTVADLRHVGFNTSESTVKRDIAPVRKNTTR